MKKFLYCLKIPNRKQKCQLQKLFESKYRHTSQIKIYLIRKFLKNQCNSGFSGKIITITCSKLTTETLEQGVRYVQS